MCAIWIILPFGHSLTSVTAATVPLAPVIGTWTTVQVALTDLNTRAAAAGAAGQIQYNGGGSPAAFAASAYLAWDNATTRLNLSSGAGGSPGVHISEPTSAHSGSIYVNNVGMQIIGGANTAMYLNSPTEIEIQSTILHLVGTIATGAAFIFETATSGNALVILANNHVGIGAATPAYPLEVAGDLNITGTTPVYRING